VISRSLSLFSSRPFSCSPSCIFSSPFSPSCLPARTVGPVVNCSAHCRHLPCCDVLDRSFPRASCLSSLSLFLHASFCLCPHVLYFLRVLLFFLYILYMRLVFVAAAAAAALGGSFSGSFCAPNALFLPRFSCSLRKCCSFKLALAVCFALAIRRVILSDCFVYARQRECVTARKCEQ